MLNEAIKKVEAGGRLARGQAAAVMEELLSGRAEHEEIARLLEALRQRPYAVEELAGFAETMRRHAGKVFAEGEARPERLVDTCGTGGDGAGAFNISTAAAIVAAAAGARVAKHGNRAVSSKSGSADVLEALEVKIEIPLLRVGAAIREIGIGFLFAQAAHTSMRHVNPARRQLGGRTVFNLLGPLTNPAGARSQVMGVFSADVMDLMAAALVELGTERAFVVHGAGGIGEISLAGETQVAEVHGGRVERYTVEPETFGMRCAPLEAIRGGDATENAGHIRRILDGERGPRRDIVVMNAAAALVAAGVAENFREGVEKCGKAIDTGSAKGKLRELASRV